MYSASPRPISGDWRSIMIADAAKLAALKERLRALRLARSP